MTRCRLDLRQTPNLLQRMQPVCLLARTTLWRIQQRGLLVACAEVRKSHLVVVTVRCVQSKPRDTSNVTKNSFNTQRRVIKIIKNK
jgi:hypothetical protein